MNSVSSPLSGLVAPSATPTSANGPTAQAASDDSDSAASFETLMSNALDAQSEQPGAEAKTSGTHSGRVAKKTEIKSDPDSNSTDDSIAASPGTTLAAAATFVSQILLAVTPEAAVSPTLSTQQPVSSETRAKPATTQVETNPLPATDAASSALTAGTTLSLTSTSPRATATVAEPPPELTSPASLSVAASPAPTSARADTTSIATVPTPDAIVSMALTGNTTSFATTNGTTSAAQTATVATVVSNSAKTARSTAKTTEVSAPVIEDSEKTTVPEDDSGTKIPVSVSTHSPDGTKVAVARVSVQGASSTQVSSDVQDKTVRVAVSDVPTLSADIPKSGAGTARAEIQPMQSTQNNWSGSAASLVSYDGSASSTAAWTPKASTSSDLVVLGSNSQFADAVQEAMNTPRELYPRRVEIQLHTPPGAAVTLSLTRSNGELRAQFDANTPEALQWLHGELSDLQNMNFGLAVRWSPPQLVSQSSESTDRDRHEPRSRNGERRRSQNRTDAITGAATSQGVLASTKG